VSNAENNCVQRFFGSMVWNLLGNIFFWARAWFRLHVKIIVIVHHTGNAAQMSFPSTPTKFSSRGRTNAFSTRANEHYAVNLRGVNAQLRVQSCPSNQNTAFTNSFQFFLKKCLMATLIFDAKRRAWLNECLRTDLTFRNSSLLRISKTSCIFHISHQPCCL
jgi:hypothetical protein